MSFHMTICSLSFTVVCYACLPADTEVDLWLSVAQQFTSASPLLTWGPVHLGWTLSRVAFTCRPPGDLRETWQSHQYPLWQNAGSSVTSDLSHSTLQQGRPLREQQEVAAAVIQRCYKKYKQVGTEVFLMCPYRISAFVYMFQCN